MILFEAVLLGQPIKHLIVKIGILQVTLKTAQALAVLHLGMQLAWSWLVAKPLSEPEMITAHKTQMRHSAAMNYWSINNCNHVVLIHVRIQNKTQKKTRPSQALGQLEPILNGIFYNNLAMILNCKNSEHMNK